MKRTVHENSLRKATQKEKKNYQETSVPLKNQKEELTQTKKSDSMILFANALHIQA